MKRFVFGLILISLSVPFVLFAAGYPAAPSSGYYVVDKAGKIDENYERYINALCREVELVASVRMMLLTVSATDADIEAYADEVLASWGKGSARALVMVVSFDDHKVHTALSDELEKELAKSRISRIHEDILIPEFKNRSYGKGAYRAFRLYAKEVADAYNVEFESLEKSPYIYGNDDDWEEIEDLADDAIRIAACCACWHAFHRPHWHRHWHWRWRRHHCW
jgi:uncharacterized membrane protein YgcG